MHFCIVSFIYNKTVRFFILSLFLYFKLPGSKVKVKTIHSISMIMNVSVISQCQSKNGIGIITYRLPLVHSSISKHKTQSTEHHWEVVWEMLFQEEEKRKTSDSKLSEGQGNRWPLQGGKNGWCKSHDSTMFSLPGGKNTSGMAAIKWGGKTRLETRHSGW